MPAMPIVRANLAQTAIVSLLTLAALALLGLVLAYWTWIWFGPRPEPRVEISAEPTGSMASANMLFGRPPRVQSAEAPTGLSIKLLGVVAATRGMPGYALVQLDAKQIYAVRAGEDIAPGLRLESVFADRVTLERNGTRETLSLQERGKSAPPPPPAPGIAK